QPGQRNQVNLRIPVGIGDFEKRKHELLVILFQLAVVNNADLGDDSSFSAKPEYTLQILRYDYTAESFARFAFQNFQPVVSFSQSQLQGFFAPDCPGLGVSKRKPETIVGP